MKHTATRVLVVEDEDFMANALQATLEREGLQVTVAQDGRTALSLARSEVPDLLILDVNLPDMSGLDVARRIREHSHVPILFLSARREEIDKVLALDAGGDDYVSKPVGVAELTARVRALLRRSSLGPTPAAAVTIISAGDIRVDLGLWEARVGDRVIDLAPREFSLLVTFLRHPNEVLRTADLLKWVWGEQWIGEEGVLYTYVHQLRQKLQGDPADPSRIQTVRGVGYKLVLA